ncbi:(2Fe-2S) ferredoxin domain-containing protein [Candidatus Gracilibacteria bacterium]|nr:(2Fe-2S) ferredoxin domain-containing protein [Candidatus Gracilibacteria bacterium]NJM89570.1 (2Fe-2S) ferredoxin domain-containing protein [Hydrococcus sp. RU_2_2]NJP19789.1 (2Fe-2S) ferredoxin domain-containing protein [Hydrococcus sp. CRU_1_1]
MSKFSCWVTPLNCRTIEPLYANQSIEYEDFPCAIDVIGPLLYTLFQERWQDTQIGHVVEGSVLELELTQPPKICILYDGYLTVATEAWHLHLCIEEHLGGPLCKTPPELRQQRAIHRAAFYRRLNENGQARSWGIQFWNGIGEKMMNLFLPNPFLGEDEDLLPERKPRLDKLSLYEELREIYVLGIRPIPFNCNPLKRPYISVCRSSRCYPSRNWKPIYEALQQAVDEAGIDVTVMSAGCLEVCKLGAVVFYSGDRTWYTRVTPDVARQIVNEHLVNGLKVNKHLYP